MKKTTKLFSFLLLFAIACCSKESEVKSDVNPSEITVETNIPQEFIDPDLNLSIEELKAKYPIDWLEKKYGNWEEFCDNYGYCECEINPERCDEVCKIPPRPNNVVCGFYHHLNYDLERLSKFSSDELRIKIIPLEFFSEAELKSIFVNKSDSRQIKIIEVFIDQIANKKPGTLTDFEKKIVRFAFAPQVINSYDFVLCPQIEKYLEIKCSYSNRAKQDKEVKQKFKELFFSKL